MTLPRSSTIARLCCFCALLCRLCPARSNTQLGAVSFPISCPASLTAAFERGLALLHSFEYRPAREQFQQIEHNDAGCAIAYWGDAMTYYHQLWDRPSPDDLVSGRNLIQKAQESSEQNQRERAYIAAAAAFYSGASNRSYEDRWAAYSKAMREVSNNYPTDREAAAFYALSLIASPHAAENHQALRKQALSILQPLFAADSLHPGLAHYIIHACDNPEMAQQGLAAARVYARIAPASPHALHMPSHIFGRLGLWQDDVQSNIASKAAAETVGERGHRLHAMDFLEYAYLQNGDLTKARAIVAEALAIPKGSPGTPVEGPSPAWVQVHFPGQYALETGAWKEAQSITAPAGAFPEVFALAAWTRAVATGHLHDAVAARAAAADFDRALDQVRHTSYAYVADDLASPRDEVQAWLAYTENRASEAMARLRQVAGSQDLTGAAQTEIPAREMLADMLLASGRPAEALAQYRQTLETNPNRRRSLHGAETAAALCRKGRP